jgi:putative ABC transport system permease protein
MDIPIEEMYSHLAYPREVLQMTDYLRALMARLLGLLGIRKADLEFDDEIRAHLELLTARYIRQGMTLDEAAAAARRRFGNVAMLKEVNREMRGIRFIETLVQDLRYSLTILKRNPGLSFVVMLTLALGIGANTAIFSVVNPLVFNPLPYHDPQQLVWVTHLFRGNEQIGTQDYLNYQAQSQTFDHLAAYDGSGNQVWASASLFPTLGVAPLMGRSFTPEDERPGAPQVMILSHDFWQRSFGGDPSVIGRSVPFGKSSRLIIGVMPPGFRFLAEKQVSEERLSGNVEVWVPDPMYSQRELKKGEDVILENVIGRLKPGVSLEQAQSELDLIFRRNAQTHPDYPPGMQVRVIPLAERLVGHLRRGLLTLFGLVGFVLLIACANVANLLLARSNARQKELAIRAAVGAGRSRLIRQMLTETLLLAIIGGAAGLLLAWWGVKTLVVLIPENLPQLRVSRIDGSVISFTFLATLLTSVAAGLIPALQAARIDLNESLKGGARSAAFFIRPRTQRVSPALVIGELALTLVVLIGAGLLIKSFLRLLAVDPGYNPKNLLTLVASPRNPAQQERFKRELLPRLNALPGVLGAANSRSLPLSDDGIINEKRATIVDRPLAPDEEKLLAESHYVGPGYFRVMGMRLRAGRGFTEQDTENTPLVVVISDSLARRAFLGEDPIGKRVRIEGGKAELTIVGVVADVKRYGLEAETHAEIYHSSLQTDEWGGRWIIRTAGDPLKLVPAIRQQLRELDPDIQPFQLTTMEQSLAESYAPRRFQLILFGLFAALALVIAAVGIYGVISYAVNQRTQEIGIRMALGAQASDVLRMVIRRGLILALIGVALGLAAAIGLTRIMKNLLFQVTPTDPATFALIALFLVGVALIANYIPARRAAKIDPLQALRRE